MLECQKELFELDPEVCYLNTAYMSPAPTSVKAAGMEGLLKKSRPYEISVDDFFSVAQEIRVLFSKLIDNDDPDRIAIIPSTSYGIANVIKNLHKTSGDEIVVVGDQFPSNIYPWKRVAIERNWKVRIVNAPKTAADRGVEWNNKLREAISEKTAVLAIPNVHWADGTKYDLVELRKCCDRHDVRLIVDGTQSVGALDFSVKDVRPDALICSAYKWLLGPYSLGVAYYGPAFDGGVPIEENWIHRKDSQDFARLVDYQDEYRPKAHRYSMGEVSNFIGLPMLGASLKQLLAWGVNNIQDYCMSITEPTIARLRTEGFEIDSLAGRSSHLFGIRLMDDFDLDMFKSRIAAEKVMVSIRGDFIRVSPHVFNTTADLETLMSLLVACKSRSLTFTS